MFVRDHVELYELTYPTIPSDTQHAVDVPYIILKFTALWFPFTWASFAFCMVSQLVHLVWCSRSFVCVMNRGSRTHGTIYGEIFLFTLKTKMFLSIFMKNRA